MIKKIESYEETISSIEKKLTSIIEDERDVMQKIIAEDVHPDVKKLILLVETNSATLRRVLAHETLAGFKNTRNMILSISKRYEELKCELEKYEKEKEEKKPLKGWRLYKDKLVKVTNFGLVVAICVLGMSFIGLLIKVDGKDILTVFKQIYELVYLIVIKKPV